MYGPTWPFLLILIVYGPGVVFVKYWDKFCTWGRAPRTKKTLPDFMSSVGLPDIHDYFAGWQAVNKPPGIRASQNACSKPMPIKPYVIVYLLLSRY